MFGLLTAAGDVGVGVCSFRNLDEVWAPLAGFYMRLSAVMGKRSLILVPSLFLGVCRSRCWHQMLKISFEFLAPPVSIMRWPPLPP